MEKTAVNAVSAHLLLLVVNTRGGSVEEVRRVGTAGGLEHVHADGGVVEAEDGLVGADEAHTAHVGGEVVHLRAAGGSPDGHIELAQIIVDKDVAEFVVLHELVGLPVCAGDWGRLRGGKRLT